MEICPENEVIISVVMPCYNAEKYIKEAINSILNQTFVNLELIIVNDGSTDSTENLVREISDDRIQYLVLPRNQGNYTARNAGMKMVRGKFIAMADADDISFPDRLHTQYKYFEAHPDIAAIGGHCELINEWGETVGKSERPLDNEEIKVALLMNNYVWQPTLMFRTELIESGYMYDEHFLCSGDYDFVYRVSRSFPIVNLDKVLVKYRVHPEQISSAKRNMQIHYANRVRMMQLEDLEISYTEVELAIHLKLMLGQYMDDTELVDAEAWLNKLNAHNEQTDNYHKAYFHQMCQKVAQLAIKKNQLGGWSIEKELLEFIKSTIPFGEPILEFGSGVGTEALLKHYPVTSLEHNSLYVFNRGDHHHCTHAPIKMGWYTREVVKEILDMMNYSLILIDGPPDDLRKGVLDHLDLFEGVRCPVIFDDMDRGRDREVMEEFCKVLGKRYYLKKGRMKIYAVCVLD